MSNINDEANATPSGASQDAEAVDKAVSVSSDTEVSPSAGEEKKPTRKRAPSAKKQTEGDTEKKVTARKRTVKKSSVDEDTEGKKKKTAAPRKKASSGAKNSAKAKSDGGVDGQTSLPLPALSESTDGSIGNALPTNIQPVAEIPAEVSAVADEPVAGSPAEVSAVADDHVAENPAVASAVTVDPVAESPAEVSAVAEEPMAESSAEVSAVTNEPVAEIPADASAVTDEAVAESSAEVSEPYAYEISFFENEDTFGSYTQATQPTLSDNAPDASQEAPDADQISFFEDDGDDKIPDAPKEIPLFIPKAPKSGAVVRKRQYNPDKPRGTDTAFDFIELFIISLVAVLILTSFFFRHSKVVGDSMMSTLYDGEHLIISDAFYTPSRGDIVVIEDKSINLSGAEEGHYALVKRVIAIEGDHIVVTPEGIVYLNGERLREDYYFTDGPVFERRVELTVPEGEIFVMGDHRNNSTDSRRFGTVKVDCVIGRALIRVYPFEKFGKIE